MVVAIVQVKNLDTGESCDISEVDTVFPQTAQVMTIDTFIATAKPEGTVCYLFELEETGCGSNIADSTVIPWPTYS